MGKPVAHETVFRHRTGYRSPAAGQGRPCDDDDDNQNSRINEEADREVSPPAIHASSIGNRSATQNAVHAKSRSCQIMASYILSKNIHLPSITPIDLVVSRN